MPYGPARASGLALCRDKEHSTIIYEAADTETSLLRLGWNKQDPRYMATLIMDTCKARVLPVGPCAEHAVPMRCMHLPGSKFVKWQHEQRSRGAYSCVSS